MAIVLHQATTSVVLLPMRLPRVLILLLAMASTWTTARALVVLYAGKPAQYEEYAQALQKEFELAQLEATITNDLDCTNAEYIVFSPKGPLLTITPTTTTDCFARYPNLKAVLSLRAGVEGTESVPLDIPITRCCDAGLKEGMVEYVVGHVLRYHLGMDQYRQNQRDGKWKPLVAMPTLARQRTVGILGLGELGRACAQTLSALNFRVCGWSRTPKSDRKSETNDAVTCFHGPTGLQQVLNVADVLVVLLPATPETHHILNATTFAQCKPGVAIINVGRGSAIHEDDLLQALGDDNEGRSVVSGATLDVFETEPLPADHKFWKHPKIFVTPHVAAKSRPDTTSRLVVENIKRNENGQPMLYQINRKLGY